MNTSKVTPQRLEAFSNYATEVDERTLRNIFYQHFFLSPQKFMKRCRLNAVKSAVIKSDPSQIKIADIANNFGFWHMGQFAKDYRQLFGELPSATLRRV